MQVALERLNRRNGRLSQMTLNELAEEYLVQHEAEPRTIAKLRWLLAKATCAFGDRRVVELRSDEIGAWRSALPEGHRFEATQALRQGAEPRCRLEDRRLEPCQGRGRQSAPAAPGEASVRVVGGDRRACRAPRRAYGPMVVFAAASGLRPGEWIALEHRDLDREARVVYVRRAFAHGRLKNPKTRRSMRAVPLQSIALEALDRLRARRKTPLLFQAPLRGLP